MNKKIASIKRRIQRLVRLSEDGTGVGGGAVKRLRSDIYVALPFQAYWYFEHHIDARDRAWRLSSAFSLDTLLSLKGD